MEILNENRHESEMRCLANLIFKNDGKMRFSLEKLLEDGLFARENERRCWKQNSGPLESRWTFSYAISSNFLYMLRFYFLSLGSRINHYLYSIAFIKANLFT